MKSLQEIARNAAASHVMQQLATEEQREAYLNRMLNMSDDELNVMARISHIPEYSHSGFSSLAKTRFQLTLEGNTHMEALSLALAVRRALGGKTNTVGDLTVVTFVENESDGYGDTAQVPVVRMDLMMQHNES